jgi:hypothetical protein
MPFVSLNFMTQAMRFFRCSNQMDLYGSELNSRVVPCVDSRPLGFNPSGKIYCLGDDGEQNARNFATGLGNAFQARVNNFSHRNVI